MCPSDDPAATLESQVRRSSARFICIAAVALPLALCLAPALAASGVPSAPSSPNTSLALSDPAREDIFRRIGDVEVEAVFQQAGTKSDESLERLLSMQQAAQVGSDRYVEAFYARATWLRTTGRMDEAIAMAAELEKLGAAPGAWRARSAAMDLRASDLITRGDMDESIALARKALTDLPPDAPLLHRINHTYSLSVAQYRKGDLDKALAMSMALIELSDQAGSADRRITARLLQNFVYGALGQQTRALALIDESLRIAESSGTVSERTKVMLYNTLGATQVGNSEAQKSAYSKALVHARRADNRVSIALVLSNLACVAIESGDAKAGVVYAREALEIANAINYTIVVIDATLRLGLGEFLLHDRQAGRRHIEEARAMAHRSGQLSWIVENLPAVGQELERAGEVSAALQVYRDIRNVSDQVLRADKRKAILELEETLAKQQRDAQLGALRRQSALRSEQLHHRAVMRQFIVALTASGALALSSVLWMAWRMRRANRSLAHLNGRLLTLSEEDPLTGLGNRRYLQARLPEFVDNGNFRGTLCLIDIDHFKRINDSYGHDGGDAVLVEAAKRLRDSLRGGDLVVRWGGEEFLAVLPHDAGRNASPTIARLLENLRGAPVDWGTTPIAVTASMGWASFPLNGVSSSITLEAGAALVDAAMYIAKRQGRDRAVAVRHVHACDAAEFETAVNDMQAMIAAGKVTLETMGERTLEQPQALQLSPA